MFHEKYQKISYFTSVFQTIQVSRQITCTVSNRFRRFYHWKAQVLNTSFFEVSIFVLYEFFYNFIPERKSGIVLGQGNNTIFKVSKNKT